MKKSLIYIVAVIMAALSLSSCEKSNPTPEPTPEPTTGFPFYAHFDGDSVEIKRVFLKVTGENEYYNFFLSPENATSADDCINGLYKYIQISVPVSKLGLEIDVTTEKEYFGFYNMTNFAQEIAYVHSSDDYSATVSAGKFTVNADEANGTAAINFDIVSLNGKSFTATFDGKLSVNNMTEDVLNANGEVLKIKSAFYEKEDDNTNLYLTPSFIENGSNLPVVASFYTMLGFDNSLATGSSIDITTTTKSFKFTFHKPLTEETVTFSNTDLQGFKGSFTVKENKTGDYKVEFKFSDDKMTFEGNYNGLFKPYSSKEPNQYSLGYENPVAINSVVVDQRDAEIAIIYISSTENVTSVEGMSTANDVVELAVPADKLEGTIVTFTSYEKAYINFRDLHFDQTNCSAYDNTLASGANIEATLEGDSMVLRFNIYGIVQYEASLTGHFDGKVTLVK